MTFHVLAIGEKSAPVIKKQLQRRTNAEIAESSKANGFVSVSDLRRWVTLWLRFDPKFDSLQVQNNFVLTKALKQRYFSIID